MADSSGLGAGKPSGASDPSVRPKGKRTQGGRVVESRYLEYEKKVRKDAAADPARTRGKAPEGGRKAGPLHKGRADSGSRRELQSTMLEGHSLALPHQDFNLDLSAIHDTSRPRKTLPLDKTTSKKARSAAPGAPQKKNSDLQEAMDMIESQTLLLTLLTVKMENNVARLEVEGGRRLLALARERARLQRQAHELQRACALRDQKQALATQLDAQEEMLRPLLAVADRFGEQYQHVASALDSTRHELPVHSVHLPGDGLQLLDALQPELLETRRLLGELGLDPAEGEAPLLGLLSELRTASQEKDAQLCRYFSQVLELDAEASKEAALGNQQAWEEAVGPASSRWYFSPDGLPAEPVGIALPSDGGCEPCSP